MEEYYQASEQEWSDLKQTIILVVLGCFFFVDTIFQRTPYPYMQLCLRAKQSV